ncbi:MAG: hypothetical protein JNM14_13475 [Ferruginibacter sp.]|nr:hypothetical protein [Ferruginibacter sp.]
MIKKIFIAAGIIAGLAACSKKFYLRVTAPAIERTGGTVFYKTVAAWKWAARDSLAVQEILAGNIPSFFKKFVAVGSSIKDSLGNTHEAVFFVSPDYIAIGTDEDWARIPLTPMAAQKIADSFHCFLPTRKMVDLIYQQSVIKLEPVPMYAFRDSSVTMWQHHLIVEGQRKGRSGLIAGIKKDLVISGKVSRDPRSGREAIYGWHQLNGKPIQPLYTGHINWWVDYSHGARLIYEKIKVDGREMHYTDVLKHPLYQKLLCDEDWCDFYKYPY